jgi:hypothetical protein
MSQVRNQVRPPKARPTGAQPLGLPPNVSATNRACAPSLHRDRDNAFPHPQPHQSTCLALLLRRCDRQSQLLALPVIKCDSMKNAESLRIRRFNVKYILKLAVVAIVPLMLIAGVCSASAAQHHHRRGHRAHHRASRHHSHQATAHRNPNQ